ncbi:sensor histidine kinase [Methanoregula sp. UBA64]|uniref:sensor histidine kinase n=1 Tax=Methanoregula sp. UBA64 TaxID=1915554 RepID=UPI0026013F0F|nr:HAMP domain-containing sensor histidine kinase [Methanoregula sp. UBA64]
MFARPQIQALLVAVTLLAVLLPYWWLAVLWSKESISREDTQFAFATTTFLLVMVIADMAFLIRYYQVKRKREILEMTRELRASEEALRLTNKKINLLSSITRHDIRNQLTALKIYLELSRITPADPEKAAEYVEKEEQIALAIERQLEFTRQYESLGVNTPVFQDLASCIGESKAGLNLDGIAVQVAGIPGAEIYADPLLKKVFFNLFDNSLRHGGRGMNAITISAALSSGRLVITFEDNGIGIEAGKKELIFDREYGQNTGLGLFLIREILDITRIAIIENGTPGSGARFEIMVPAGAYRVTS